MGRKTVYNSVITPELWDSVNQENKDLLNDFLDYKRSSDKSPNTIEQYFQVLRLFFVWDLQNCNNKFFVDLKKRDFIKFFNYMVTEMKASPNRIATVKSILSSLSNYIENILDDEFEDYRNIVIKLDTVVKEPVREKTILSENQITECLDELVKDGKYQIACYMALAAACGARKSELLRFKVNYFDDDNIVFGCFYKTPEMIKTKGRGSRGKQLYKYTFISQFKPYFDLWMAEREKLGIESEWLFVINRDNEWSQAKVHNANNWAEVITSYLNEPFYSHSMRHYLCTLLSKKGIPAQVIKELFGWSSIELVSIYDDNDATDIFGEYFDENGIKADIKKKNLTDL